MISRKWEWHVVNSTNTHHPLPLRSQALHFYHPSDPSDPFQFSYLSEFFHFSHSHLAFHPSDFWYFFHQTLHASRTAYHAKIPAPATQISGAQQTNSARIQGGMQVGFR